MKSLVLTSLIGGGLLAFAVLSPQTVIEKQASILKDAKSLKVAYTFQHVPGGRVEYTLTYSKPNLVLVEGPDRVVESDGKTLWEYNKADKTYTETALTDALLAKKAQADEVIAWASFFTEDFVKGMSNYQGGTARNIKGSPCTEVTVTLAGSTPRTATIYVDDKLGIARGFSLKGGGNEVLAMATTIEVGKEPLTPDKFAFAAPAGAKKVEVAVAATGTGYASVKPIFEGNCLPCHSESRAKGGYVVTSYQGVMGGGKIVPGDPDSSQLVKLLTGDAQPRMPQGRAPLAQADIDKIKAWIKDGAKE